MLKHFNLTFQIWELSHIGSDRTNKPTLKIVKGNQIIVRQKAAKMACFEFYHFYLVTK